ncbi:unnamed protein product, partial [Symbiodinium sp. CCMP2592]
HVASSVANAGHSKGQSRELEPKPPRPPRQNQAQRALTTIWESLPEHARQQIEEAGWRPKLPHPPPGLPRQTKGGAGKGKGAVGTAEVRDEAAQAEAARSLFASVSEEQRELLCRLGIKEPEAQPQDLASLCKQHIRSLPADIQKLLEDPPERPPTPQEVMSETSKKFKIATAELRDLIFRKAALQVRLDKHKELYSNMLSDMKSINESLEERQKLVASLQGELQSSVAGVPAPEALPEAAEALAKQVEAMDVDQLDDYRQRLVEAIDEAVKRRRVDAPAQKAAPPSPFPAGPEVHQPAATEGDKPRPCATSGKPVQFGMLTQESRICIKLCWSRSRRALEGVQLDSRVAGTQVVLLDPYVPSGQPVHKVFRTAGKAAGCWAEAGSPAMQVVFEGWTRSLERSLQITGDLGSTGLPDVPCEALDVARSYASDKWGTRREVEVMFRSWKLPQEGGPLAMGLGGPEGGPWMLAAGHLSEAGILLVVPLMCLITEGTFHWKVVELAVETQEDVPPHVAGWAIDDALANLKEPKYRDDLCIVSANVSSWRKDLCPWVAQLGASVVMLQETHLSPDQPDLIEGQLGVYGFNVFSVPGQPTGRGGTSGGMAICFRKHLNVRRVHQFFKAGAGFQVAAIRLRDTDCYLVNLYLKAGEGFQSATNSQILANLLAFLTSARGIYFAAGDLNEDFETIAASSFAQEAKGHWISSGESTCAGGGNIDFGLLSPILAAGAKLVVDWDTPFAPHAALHWTLQLEHFDFKLPQLIAFKPVAVQSQEELHLLGTEAEVPKSRSAGGPLLSPLLLLLVGVGLTPLWQHVGRWRHWFELWSHPAGVDRDLLASLKHAAQEQARLLHPIDLERAVGFFKKVPTKAPGLDGWTCEMLRNLSVEAVQAILEFFHHCEREASWPDQMVFALIALLPKSEKRERPIALLHILYRAWAKLRWPLVATWQAAYAARATWDKAVPGGQALDVALARLMLGESVRRCKSHLITLFLDMETFYDRCVFDDVIRSGLSLGYPPLVLHQALLTYMGPRFIQSEGALCPPIWPGRGVLAGCPAAPSVSKLVIHPVAEKLASKKSACNLDIWIDDLSLDSVNKSPVQVASDSLLLFRALRRDLEARGAQISISKTCFVASSTEAAKAMSKILDANDPQVKSMTRDLGVTSAGGRRRVLGLAEQRRKKAAGRSRKLNRLAIPGRAHRLRIVKASVCSAGLWGHQAQGTSLDRLISPLLSTDGDARRRKLIIGSAETVAQGPGTFVLLVWLGPLGPMRSQRMGPAVLRASPLFHSGTFDLTVDCKAVTPCASTGAAKATKPLNKKQRMLARLSGDEDSLGHQWVKGAEGSTNMTMKCAICGLYLQQINDLPSFDRLMRPFAAMEYSQLA